MLRCILHIQPEWAFKNTAPGLKWFHPRLKWFTGSQCLQIQKNRIQFLAWYWRMAPSQWVPIAPWTHTHTHFSICPWAPAPQAQAILERPVCCDSTCAWLAGPLESERGRSQEHISWRFVHWRSLPHDTHSVHGGVQHISVSSSCFWVYTSAFEVLSAQSSEGKSTHSWRLANTYICVLQRPMQHAMLASPSEPGIWEHLPWEVGKLRPEEEEGRDRSLVTESLQRGRTRAQVSEAPKFCISVTGYFTVLSFWLFSCGRCCQEAKKPTNLCLVYNIFTQFKTIVQRTLVRSGGLEEELCLGDCKGGGALTGTSARLPRDRHCGRVTGFCLIDVW